MIVDASAAGGRDLVWIAEQAIQGGADVLQLRAKHASTRQLLEEARRILRVTRAAKVPLLINDRVDVALAAEADGVHVGQDDLPVEVARTLLGSDRIIGKSTHSLEQALEADREPCDYLAVGPIFPTPTKPAARSVGTELVRHVVASVRKPVIVIGGIDAQTSADVAEAGARCVAVVRAVCGAEDPKAAVRDLRRRLQSVRPIDRHDL